MATTQRTGRGQGGTRNGGQQQGNQRIGGATAKKAERAECRHINQQVAEQFIGGGIWHLTQTPPGDGIDQAGNRQDGKHRRLG